MKVELTEAERVLLYQLAYKILRRGDQGTNVYMTDGPADGDMAAVLLLQDTPEVVTLRSVLVKLVVIDDQARAERKFLAVALNRASGSGPRADEENLEFFTAHAKREALTYAIRHGDVTPEGRKLAERLLAELADVP